MSRRIRALCTLGSGVLMLALCMWLWSDDTPQPDSPDLGGSGPAGIQRLPRATDRLSPGGAGQTSSATAGDRDAEQIGAANRPTRTLVEGIVTLDGVALWDATVLAISAGHDRSASDRFRQQQLFDERPPLLEIERATTGPGGHFYLRSWTGSDWHLYVEVDGRTTRAGPFLASASNGTPTNPVRCALESWVTTLQFNEEVLALGKGRSIQILPRRVSPQYAGEVRVIDLNGLAFDLRFPALTVPDSGGLEIDGYPAGEYLICVLESPPSHSDEWFLTWAPAVWTTPVTLPLPGHQELVAQLMRLRIPVASCPDGRAALFHDPRSDANESQRQTPSFASAGRVDHGVLEISVEPGSYLVQLPPMGAAALGVPPSPRLPLRVTADGRTIPSRLVVPQ